MVQASGKNTRSTSHLFFIKHDLETETPPRSTDQQQFPPLLCLCTEIAVSRLFWMNELVHIYHFMQVPMSWWKPQENKWKLHVRSAIPRPLWRLSHPNRSQPRGSTATNSLYAKYISIFLRTRQDALQAWDIATPKTVLSSSPEPPLLGALWSVLVAHPVAPPEPLPLRVRTSQITKIKSRSQWELTLLEALTLVSERRTQ